MPSTWTAAAGPKCPQCHTSNTAVRPARSTLMTDGKVTPRSNMHILSFAPCENTCGVLYSCPSCSIQHDELTFVVE